ncbi:hypothetical protein LTR66_011743 [Elasticomyces elasticus]|nr:hypothetical protein LTR66_011743 [Elasticomyces elasticus]
MPYTPPSQQSPASSKASTPTLSRTPSYTKDSLSQSPASHQRPGLPRSLSSTSYLNRHRRSPSIQDPTSGQITHADGANVVATQNTEKPLNTNGSLRQSPPPVNNLLIPTGAIISPPDSPEDSDGDESAARQRRREELHGNWGELHMAVRSIELRRESSPERDGNTPDLVASPTEASTSRPAPLSTEARKISHSRSSTETALIIPARAAFTESPTQTSEDSDADEDVHVKPPLVRKKSGELVKPALRPSSRRRYSSMPGTPTYSKSVHFNDNGNQTRHFLQVDKPMAVSASSSPVETYENETEYPFEGRTAPKVEWDIKLANLPEETPARKALPIRLERLFLSADKKTLIGSVAVQNLAFYKLVVARFTLDYWKTTSEVVAEYNNDVRRKETDDGCDRFTFNIKLSDQANLEAKTLLLCIRYNVNGQEYWDNNDNTNYQVDFVKTVRPARVSIQLPMQGELGARPLNAIPRSKHSQSPPTSSHGRGRQPSIDDDFATQLGSNSTYQLGSARSLIGESPNNSLKLKPRNKRGSMFPGPTSPSNGLGGRYDFGASLSAALYTAQDKLGKQGGMVTTAEKRPETNYFSKDHHKAAQSAKPTDLSKPEALTTSDRPAIGSDQYRDLVQKFCYFTSGKSSPQTGSSASKPAANDGALDEDSVSDCSARNSGSSTPTPSPSLDGTSDRRAVPSSLSPFTSRSSSPAPITGHAVRTASSVSFGYPYHQNMRDGYLAESHTPTAIRG